MGKYFQSSFIGGLNRQYDPTKIEDNQYPLVINGRTRDDEITPIYLPTELDFPEATNIQGIYSAGFYLIVFADGKGYYRSFNPDSPTTTFQQISGFQLDSSVDRIYLELVPGSSINFKRQLRESGKVSEGVDLTTLIGGSPDCAYVTDGVNQGWIIFPDGTARVTQTWDQWSDTVGSNGASREYVPVGTYPMYLDGVLYQAALDPSSGRLNRIVRSVTGRPLDYMIVVDVNGNKAVNQLAGDANVLAHRVDYNTITAISKISALDGAFFVGTSYNSYLVTPKLDKLIFSEPTFSNRWLFNTGPLNPFCVVDALGDTLIVDSKGIISFNATLAVKYEGRNLPFSRKIHPLFKNITQTVACTIKLDNYIYFGVNTVYGPAVVVYDEMLEVWVSVDIYPGVNLVKQFAVISTTNTKRLFFITVDNKVYESFTSTQVATCRAYLGEWFEKEHQKILNVGCSFKDILIAGNVYATLFTDGKKIETQVQPVDITKIASTEPLEIPFGRSTEDQVIDLNFNFDNPPAGKKHGILVEWNCNGILSAVEVNGAPHNTVVDSKQEALIQQSGTNIVGNSSRLMLVGWAGSSDTTLTRMINQAKDGDYDKYVLLGNNNQPSGALATLQTNVINYWDKLKDQDKVIALAGRRDLDTLNGQAHFQYFNQPFRYFKISYDAYTDLFILNSGINSAMTLVEPDGNDETSTQALWLKNQLSSSFKKFKIVLVFENPLYYSTLNWPFKRWGASLVVCAGNNNYERLYNEDNLNVINVGSGSTTLGLLAFVYPYKAESKFRDNIHHGYVELEITPIGIQGKFIAYPNEEIIDTFQILG